MTKNEAIQAMKEGNKITHTYFTTDEFIRMEKDWQIITEEGYTIGLDTFFGVRNDNLWEYGYEIWTPKGDAAPSPSSVDRGIEGENERLASQVAILREALEKIAKWELPVAGEFWDRDKKQLMSYEAAYGSNGSRDYIKSIAKSALDQTK